MLLLWLITASSTQVLVPALRALARICSRITAVLSNDCKAAFSALLLRAACCGYDHLLLSIEEACPHRHYCPSDSAHLTQLTIPSPATFMSPTTSSSPFIAVHDNCIALVTYLNDRNYLGSPSLGSQVHRSGPFTQQGLSCLRTGQLQVSPLSWSSALQHEG